MSDDKAYMHLQHYGGIASNHIIIENHHTHITSLLLAIDLLIFSKRTNTVIQHKTTNKQQNSKCNCSQSQYQNALCTNKK